MKEGETKHINQTVDLKNLERILKDELIRLQDGFPEDYYNPENKGKKTNFPLGRPIVLDIYKWLLKNIHQLKGLSPQNPLRFAAVKKDKKPSEETGYPFEITIHLTTDETGNVHIEFDPGSKFSPDPESHVIQKPEEK